MGSERVADFLFVGLTVLPSGLFAVGYPDLALFLFFPLLIGACLSGSGPWEPEKSRPKAATDAEPEAH
jgi:hypothetical protein